MSDIQSEGTNRFKHDQLESFVESILKTGGVTESHAERVAEALVRADMRGVSSHGVARLQAYMEKFEAGGFNSDPDIEVTDLSDSVALIDADDGPGQSAAYAAMEEAINCADDTGVGMVAVTNSNHFGTAAYYTERASSEDYIGISMTNVGPDVIPFGGATRFLGTNPISVSVPTDREFPITLDMATSVVAMGKIQEVSRREDTDIPSDWAVDADGESTTDPHEAVAVRPLGGPKGYGLGVIVDVLCGLVSGAGPSPSVGPLYGDYDKPMRLGHFVGAIDVSAFRDLNSFKHDVDEYISDLKAIETRDGFEEVMLPGEIEAGKLREQREHGVELQQGAVSSLKELADFYDVPLPAQV